MTTPPQRNSISCSPLRRSLLLIPLALACFALPPELKSQGCGGCTPDYVAHQSIDQCTGSYDGLSFLDNSSWGCSALYNATTTIWSDPICGPCGDSYSGPVMSYNTAIGSHALYNNTTGGNYNSAIGAYALYSNTTGKYNTANGVSALRSNNIGTFNTANGSAALYSNTLGNGNTATGVNALRLNNGNYNTANGVSALVHNTSGTQNTGNGVNALYYNTTGIYNTALGVNALYYNTGSNNIGLGRNAGYNLTTGSGNVCIGSGVLGVAAENNTTRIGNVYASVASGRAVYVNSDNKIGTLASTRRVKESIKPMDKASEAILALKPVSFRYKKEIDASHTPQFGLIAEDVADISPDLVTRDAEGKPETVRYDSINAMLLNEFLKQHNGFIKEHGKVQELEATVANQQKQIEALTMGLQKVSAQVEMNRAPQMVSSNQ